MTPKDLFSVQSDDYARYRPVYPAQLFSWLASVAPARDAAVDVATGNGQAALGLAPHFAHVAALDLSASQLGAAAQHPKIEYRVAPAENTGLPEASADLLTAAQAFHWFEPQVFFTEAGRVLRPGGVLAFWCYALAQITPAVDAVVWHLYSDILGPHWEPERRLVEDGYRSVAAPFLEIVAPPFTMKLEWELGHLIGYLSTWSALRAYERAHGKNPLLEVQPDLAAAWGNAPTREASWALGLRAFRR